MTLSFAPERIEPWPLERLKPYARNAKTHGADQVAKIAGSMAQFGWTVPCLVADDGELIAGHGRVLAAEQLGLTEAPVIVLGHLTEAQRRAYRSADNRLTELGVGRGAARRRAAGAGGRRLRPVARRLLRRRARPAARLRRRRRRAVGGARHAAGRHPRAAAQPGVAHRRSLDPRRPSAALRRQHQRVGRPPADERRAGDAVRDRSAVSRGLRRLEPPDPQQGLVAELRRHLGRQFAGRRALRRLHRRRSGRGHRRGRRLVLLARLAPPGDARGLLGEGGRLRAPADHLGEGPRRPDPVALPLEARALLHGLAPPEPSAEGRRRNAGLDLGDPEPARTTARTIRRRSRSTASRSRCASTWRGAALCYEPFSGSGSQIMAGEANGRRVFAMEISPAYVDVAVERWQAETGRDAILDGDGRSFAAVKAERLGAGRGAGARGPEALAQAGRRVT